MVRIKFAILLLLFPALSTDAQTDNGCWRKRVGRIIDVAPTADSSASKTTAPRKSYTLIGMIIDAIHAGKLIAYSNYDADFTTKLSAEGLKNVTVGKTDTMAIMDPVTGKETLRITQRDFDGSLIHKFRLLEEWTFNPLTGKTEIQITGIAPIREIYDEDGSFRGVQAMFWVKYNDAHSIIDKYDKLHPRSTVESYIWNDYFLNGNSSGEVYKSEAVRLIDLSEKDDNATHHLTDAHEDSSIYAMVVARIQSGNLIVYPEDDHSMTNKLSYETLDAKRYGVNDTIIVTDPITNQYTMGVSNSRFQNFTINKYKLLEELVFDTKTGKTTINIKGMGPFAERNNYNTNLLKDQLLFWINFKDLHSIIASYEAYHPDNTIAGHIWADYFLSDVRPEAVK